MSLKISKSLRYQEINVIDLSDNHYDIYKSGIKNCIILLIDDINTSRIFVSEKNMYYIRYDDDDCDETVYYKILGNIDRVESDRNDIVNLIDRAIIVSMT